MSYKFFIAVGVPSTKNPLASLEQGPVPEEKYQTLLTNEKQGKNY
jgi:hypothetical protein